MTAKNHLYFIVYKPYGVLSQFSEEDGNPGLGSLFNLPKDVYPLGRLDLDSEGLLLLSNDKKLNFLLLDPKNAHQRTYWAEVEGRPDDVALQKLRQGPIISVKGKSHKSLPLEAELLDKTPDIAERTPPVNRLKHPITSWLELKLIEGKNRQVRKLTASVGHPTLRLVRVSIGDLQLFPLKPGEIRQLSKSVVRKKLHLAS